jgi:DNA-binding NarL/FixJ family response regulator
MFSLAKRSLLLNRTKVPCLTLAFLQFVVWCKDRRKAMNAGASAFYLKGVESGEFLAGIKAAAESTN